MALVAWMGLAGCSAPASSDSTPDTLAGEAVDADVAPEPSAFVTDDRGGALVLHGVSISNSAKYEPLRNPWCERDDVLRLSRDWGLNFSRYLIFWDALEPQPGEYDEAYLDRVQERLDWHRDAGIFVVLDMHQDLYSNALAPLGDGAPAWAVETDGLPVVPTSQWELYHLQPGVAAAYENFFDYPGDHPELQDHYLAAWTHVIARFKDHPAVLGYEIMNEPFSKAALGKGKDAFDAEWLAPFYRRFIAAARAVDPDGWIFYEPQAFVVSDGQAQSLPRFEDPREGPPRLAFFPHAYSLAAATCQGDAATLTAFLDRYEAARTAEVQAYGTPLAIGEFHGGNCGAIDPWYLNEQLARFDRMRAGWAYYDYGGRGGPDGAEDPVMAQLTRVYPRRVAGEPVSYAFDAGTRVFELEFVDRAGAEGATEIVLPAARLYPDGWVLSVDDPEGSWSSAWDEATGVLSLTTARTGAPHHVRIGP